MARRHTGELTLVAAGPPTHLALQYDPEPVDHVKAVAVMGGAFGENGHRGNVSPVAKANIASDPHAADRVFTARWPVTIVGLDVTHEVLPTPPRSTRSAAKVVPRAPSSARSHTATRTSTDPRAAAASHDASAVSCALDATPFTLRRGPLRVVTAGIAAGQTFQMREGESFPSTAWAEAPAQSDCVGVDAPRLRAEFRSCFVR